MQDSYQILIDRAVSGDLKPGEREILDALLRASPELRQQLEDARKLSGLLLEARETEFSPFFVTRVMARVSARDIRESGFSTAITQAFQRVAIAAVILMIGICGYNIATQWEYRGERNAFELALAVPPATIDKSIDNLTFDL